MYTWCSESDYLNYEEDIEEEYIEDFFANMNGVFKTRSDALSNALVCGYEEGAVIILEV